MRLVILVAALAVAACGQSTAPEAAAPLPVAAPQSPVQPGVYEALSTTAAGITGNLTLSPEALVFALDQRYDTAAATLTAASTDYGAGAGTFADLLSVPAEDMLEVRAVTNVTLGDGAHGSTLCGADPVTHVALAAGEDGALKVAAFKGASAPGPQANAADLCGTFLYASGVLE